jgi:hypothetical protein
MNVLKRSLFFEKTTAQKKNLVLIEKKIENINEQLGLITFLALEIITFLLKIN